MHKIAFYIPNLDGGGAERVMLNLASGMANLARVEVDFLVAKMEGPLQNNFPPNVHLVDLGSSRIATSIVPLITYLRNTQADILISALATTNVIAVTANLLARTKTKVIVTQHTTLSVSAENANNFRSRLMPKLTSIFYRFANGIVAVSSGVADDLAIATGIDRASIEVIYNPVITPLVRKLSKEQCDDEWTRDSTTPLVLGIGRLCIEKDFANLLKAIALVVKRRKVKLILLGEGELRDNLENLVKELNLTNYVKMPGFVENPYCYMRNSDLFVLSSQCEGLPTVLIEALYCQLKLVSTDCPSGPKEILNNGRYGILAKPGDPEDLARAILEAIDKKAISPPEESWENYTLEYSISHYFTYMFDRNISEQLTEGM